MAQAMARAGNRQQSVSPNYPVCPSILRELSASALEEESGTRTIAMSVDLLRQANMLRDDGTRVPSATARALMKIGAVNLSVGRLWEGHINALHLVNLYGSPRTRDKIICRINDGALLGVWGADGAQPLIWEEASPVLKGMKSFASGLGTVSRAIVTVNSGPHVRLALVDVTDTARADADAWNMNGMRATASGTYDFTDLRVDQVEWIGQPGDYLKEPHFVGGVWRIAALQAGASAGLLDCAADQLRQMDRMQAEPQKIRLMTVLNRVWAGMALVERAAQAAARTDVTAEQVVTCSIAARLYTEEAGLDAVRAVEKSIGLRHFADGSATDRMARDLSVYLRQAAGDAFLQRAADFALGREGNIWGILE